MGVGFSLLRREDFGEYFNLKRVLVTFCSLQVQVFGRKTGGKRSRLCISIQKFLFGSVQITGMVVKESGGSPPSPNTP